MKAFPLKTCAVPSCKNPAKPGSVMCASCHSFLAEDDKPKPVRKQHQLLGIRSIEEIKRDIEERRSMAKKYLCKYCGETDFQKFYSNSASTCAKCLNKRVQERKKALRAEKNTAAEPPEIAPPTEVTPPALQPTAQAPEPNESTQRAVPPISEDSQPKFEYDCPVHGPHNGGLIAGHTRTSICPKCTEEKRVRSFLDTKRNNVTSSVLVRFPDSSLIDRIRELAAEQERTIEQQIRYLLRQAITRSNEPQQYDH